jgi:hypothetical protein
MHGSRLAGGNNDVERDRRYAEELVALGSDIILASGSVSVAALQRATRAAVVRNPTNPAGIGQFSATQALAQSLGVEMMPVNVRDAGEIERAVGALAR